MELQTLKRFVVVADEMHFRRAAAKLHIVESALSRQIQRLEEDLQVELFNRSGHRVQLTPAGVVFLNKARLLIEEWNAAVNTVRSVAEGNIDSLRIAFVGWAARSVLPTVLRAFRRRWPNVHLELIEMTTLEQIEGLRTKAIDIGFLLGPILVNLADIGFTVAARDPFVVALPTKHPLADRAALQLRDLAEERFILHPLQLASDREIMLRQSCVNAGFELKVGMRTKHFTAAIGLVSAGIGITVVPKSAAKSTSYKGVTYRPLAEPHILELLASFRKDNKSESLRNFQDVLETVVRK